MAGRAGRRTPRRRLSFRDDVLRDVDEDVGPDRLRDLVERRAAPLGERGHEAPPRSRRTRAERNASATARWSGWTSTGDGTKTRSGSVSRSVASRSRGDLGDSGGEPPVGKERAARRAAAEPLRAPRARLREAQLARLPPSGRVGLVSRAVGDDEDVDARPVEEEAGEGPSAAERLVVGVGRDDEDPPGREARRLVGEESSLGERVRRPEAGHSTRF